MSGEPLVFVEPEAPLIKLDHGFNYDMESAYTAGTVSEFSTVDGGGYVSAFSTVMNLLNSLVGAEILSISNSMTNCGLIASVALMTLTASLSYVATIMTVKLQNMTQAESLHDLALKLLGKHGSGALASLTLLFTYSCCVAYLIIGGDNIKSWCSLLGHEEWMQGWKRSIIMLVYSLLLPVALTIPRKMDILSMFSTLSIACLVVFTIVLSCKAFVYLPTHGINPTVMSYTFNLGFFNALAIYSLMFALPAIILPILKPSHPSIKKRFRIVGTAFFSCYLCVLIPGVLGYVMFGKDSNEIILTSFPNTDVVIQVVRIAFFIVVTASYPVIALSVTADLTGLIYHKNDPASLPLTQRVKVLLLANIPPVLIAMLVPSISPVLAIGGALGGCLTNFFFPAVMWVVFSKERVYKPVNLFCIFLAIFGLVSACIATYRAFWSFTHKPVD